MNANTTEAIRVRALALADSGQFNHWEEIGASLMAEGFALAMETLEADASLRTALNARCALKRSGSL
ncbi:MAG: hypothetical protein IT547_17470 [Hyphomonadaceae bacterium]|nr:hypothetical protein [Hyphomonadaceae bacterium]